MTTQNTLIVGAGPGLGASLARLCAAEGMQVALAARNADKLKDLCRATGAKAYACDSTDASAVEALFQRLDQELGALDLVVYNASARERGAVHTLNPENVRQALMVSCFGGFLVGRQAAQRMLKHGRGSILFTGASASVKGFAESSSFAMGKFGLRGLAQSMARELAPKGVHVAHFVIDGGIASTYANNDTDRAEDRFLDPDEIAKTYLQIHRQQRSAWTWEVELRPWVEKF
jgi:NAD(P)-dependent dehydrogenase (short-subunit alcohol dehydrogenase family)